MNFVCPVCGYVYDEAQEKESFSSLPETWQCPICKAAKSLVTLQGGEPAQALPEKLSQNESQSSYFSDKGRGFGRAVAFRCSL